MKWSLSGGRDFREIPSVTECSWLCAQGIIPDMLRGTYHVPWWGLNRSGPYARQSLNLSRLSNKILCKWKVAWSVTLLCEFAVHLSTSLEWLEWLYYLSTQSQTFWIDELWKIKLRFFCYYAFGRHLMLLGLTPRSMLQAAPWRQWYSHTISGWNVVCPHARHIHLSPEPHPSPALSLVCSQLYFVSHVVTMPGCIWMSHL